MMDGEQEREKQVPIATVKRAAAPRLLASALLQESGEVAAVELGRFGQRAGQIIAHGASARRDGSRGKDMHRRRPLRSYGAW
jgi:hypothetical protein